MPCTSHPRSYSPSACGQQNLKSHCFLVPFQTVFTSILSWTLITSCSAGAASRDITSHADAELSHRSRQLLQTGEALARLSKFLDSAPSAHDQDLKRTSCPVKCYTMSISSIRPLRLPHIELLPVSGTCISVPSTNFGGDVLTDGAANLQPSAGACCNVSSPPYIEGAFTPDQSSQCTININACSYALQELLPQSRAPSYLVDD